MSIEITMPALSPTMTKGMIASWSVSIGDNVQAGDIIFEVETDKVTMEVEATHSGVVAQILANEGTEATVDAVIMTLAPEGTDIKPIIAPSKSKESNNNVQVQLTETNKIKKEFESKDIHLTPLARRMVAQGDINISQLTGTGAKGRIVKQDIEKLIGINQAAPLIHNNSPKIHNPKIDYASLPAHQKIINTGMRNVVAQRLTESSRDIPHFYMTVDCEIDTLLSLRKDLNDRDGADYKISVNDFVIKAVAHAMKKVPQANCMWDGDSILTFEQVDISVAVAVDDGLITPVIKNVNGQGLAEISKNSKELVTKARDGKLKPNEYQGGTFTISNLGMFGIKDFTSIINPPQNGILSVGAGEQRAVVKNGELVIATVMTVTLAMDHRCVDGAIGARFIQAFKNVIQDPISLML